MTDGGKSRQPVDMGSAVNKIRVVPDGGHYVDSAVGVDVHKYGTPRICHVQPIRFKNLLSASNQMHYSRADSLSS